MNDLFSITNQTVEEGIILAEIRLNADHQIYEGHFPGSPVTPGVVQLQIVKELLENHLGRKLIMKGMRTCKFLQVINPLETPDIQISIKFEEGESIEVTTSGSYNGTFYFKAQVVYA
ncbi:3-hydroxyacyl-ACP dehydratase [Dyadobacter sp. CY312]|uniref:3-hydroxyacyl-ACP dehydratase n=1 Tax=Dyadobacter sp. CY312 TaxID=2907303 RepID=UPI001F39EAA6|nr:3-hydroxyacyl-ACP dehydratase [Dyadobacter sp. CY312]MCE7041524.1 3-hydroxyacyl-ACP dehydratase [Dyadobacter sp. CY312]